MNIAQPSKQLSLFDLRPVYNATSNATARNAYGHAAEYLVAKRLGLELIPIDGRKDLCFDAKKGDMYYEIKSVRTQGKIVIYRFRLAKEVASQLPCSYAILEHRLRGARHDILTQMENNIVCIHIVPLIKVIKAVQYYPLHIPTGKRYSKRQGYDRGGYALGYYNLPLKALL